MASTLELATQGATPEHGLLAGGTICRTIQAELIPFTAQPVAAGTELIYPHLPPLSKTALSGSSPGNWVMCTYGWPVTLCVLLHCARYTDSIIIVIYIVTTPHRPSTHSAMIVCTDLLSHLVIVIVGLLV